MSNLDALLKKLASTAVQQEPQSTDESDGCTDVVYVEKLASAIEFMLTDAPVVEKVAAAQPVVASDSTASKLRSLLLAKTASANQTTPTDPVADETNKIHSELQQKVATQVAPVAGESEFINSVLRKLGGLNSFAFAKKDEEAEGEEDCDCGKCKECASSKKCSCGKCKSCLSKKDKAPEKSKEPEAEASEEPSKAEGDESEKSANAKLNLAEMLKAAASAKTDDAVESASSNEVAKTAASQGMRSSDLLRNSLLRKAGRTEV